MKYVVEYDVNDLRDFPAWGNGRRNLDMLIERGLVEEATQLIQQYFQCLDRTPTDIDINDMLAYDEWLFEMLDIED